MSFEKVVAHMRRELVTGVGRRRRRERIYRAVGAVAAVTALVVAGVALAADSDRPSGVVTSPSVDGFAASSTTLGAVIVPPTATEACNMYLDILPSGAHYGFATRSVVGSIAVGSTAVAALAQFATTAAATGDVELAVNAARMRDTYDPSTPVGSADFGNAANAVWVRCRAIGVVGFNPVYVPAQPGPEPHVDLAAYGIEQRLEPTNTAPPSKGTPIPQGRSLSPVETAVSAEGGWVMDWNYQDARNQTVHCQSVGVRGSGGAGCTGIGDLTASDGLNPSDAPKPSAAPQLGVYSVQSVVGNTTYGSKFMPGSGPRSVILSVPYATSFVVLEATTQRFVQRPAAAKAMFAWTADATSTAGFTARTYDPNGTLLGCVAEGDATC
jgi:hypothetical protein